MADDQEARITLRMPAALRDRLSISAEAASRSMNGEIVSRLERSFKGWPKVNLPDDLFERVRRANAGERAELEAEITKFAIETVGRALPTAPVLHRDLQDAFITMLRLVPDGDQQEKLWQDFSKLATDLYSAASGDVQK